MKLRDAVREDVRLLFEWANDSEVREFAFSSGLLEWESHLKWFETRLLSPDTHIYIALSDRGEPIGQIRFDGSGDTTAEVDVHTRPGLRSKGVGSEIIALGVERLFQQTRFNKVHAVVKCENIKSRRAFEKAGFSLADEVVEKGHACYRLELSS